MSGLKMGISGRPSLLKSIAGTSLNRPTASFTAAIRICHTACSLSNFISVLVGWIFTSIVSAGTSK